MLGLPPENHSNEQYFFDRATKDWIIQLLSLYTNPCLVGVPTVARELGKTRLLDVDDRFSDCKGFLHWNLHRPVKLAEKFDLIICDPPFNRVSFSQLFNAIRILTHGDFNHRLLITGLVSREQDLLATFYPYGLQKTGHQPHYVSVQNQEGWIMWYSNFQLPNDFSEKGRT